MNHKEAEMLIKKVFNVWTEGTINQLSDIYDENIEAHYFGYANLKFIDIRNRFEFMRENHKNYKFELLDLLVDNNKIALRSSYTALTLKDEPVSVQTVGILHLSPEGKINRIWSMANTPVNYLEK